MEHITTVDDDGFLTIPDELLKRLGWQVNDEIEIVLSDDDLIMLTKVDKKS